MTLIFCGHILACQYDLVIFGNRQGCSSLSGEIYNLYIMKNMTFIFNKCQFLLAHINDVF